MTRLRLVGPALVWGTVLVVVTLVLRLGRADIDQAHVVLAYLLVVLGGSVSGGRTLGLALACAAFLLIDFFFQLPFDRLTVGKPLDWVILISFLVTAVVATQLLAMLRAEAAQARQHADEIAALSAERERLAEAAKHAEALREADHLKDIVLASLSHDLRTPLTTIKALAQDSALHGDLNAAVIEEQADRLSRFVGDLLDLSRLKGAAFPVSPEVNTAEDLIGAASRQVAGLLNGRTLAVSVDTSRPALVGRFDFVQALRILNNLIENALRYAPPGSPVDVSVSREGERLVFAVADRGPGIAPEERERIFEPFYRSATTGPDTGRAGLGLSIARRLAEIQNGSLDYETRPGGGSVFKLSLPAIDVLADS
ncbi:MAG: ATP-binding protein [Gemmatimonadales bacterium]